MDGDSILNYVFDYEMCQSIDAFSKMICSLTADVFLVMSRKAACFISFLKRHGKVTFDGKLVTDRILDFDTTWLNGKSVIVIDDVIVSGTTIYSVIQKLKKTGVCDIKVYVLGINERYFSPNLLEYMDANQQIISYLNPPYIPLSDAACMRTCSNIVSLFALDILPYDVDFPKHEFFSVSNSVFNQLVASSDWYTYDVSSDLQAENNVKNITMLPTEKIKVLFDQEVGAPISQLGFFKIRLFAKPNEKRTKYLINIVPYFLFNSVTSKDVSNLFDTWFNNGPTPKSNIAKIRILQYILAEKLFKILVNTFENIVPNKLCFHLDFSELSLIIPEQFHSTIIHIINSPLTYYVTLESIHKTPYLKIQEEQFESKIIAREDQKDNMAVLQTRLVEPFTSMYFSKEKASREIVIKYGKKAFEMPDYHDIIDRLNHGYSYHMLIQLLEGYPDIYDKETTVSLFIDEAIDAGVIVPIIAEEKDENDDSIYFRAYRHGEDVPFGELQEKLCAILLSAYAKEGGIATLSKLCVEKMLVLFIQIGLTQRIFSPSPHDTIYYNVNIDTYLQGSITTVQDPTSSRSYHYLKHRTDARWLTEVLSDKGIIEEKNDQIICINDNIDIDIDISTKKKVSGIGMTFAQLYKNGLNEPKITPYITEEDLVLFSTCMFPRDILNALGAELAIFVERWNRDKKRMKDLLTSDYKQVTLEIAPEYICESIKNGQKYFFSFLNKNAQQRIEEISEQLDNSKSMAVYGILWDQFWPDNRNWNEHSIDSQLLNTILNEGKFLLIFNILCHMLFLCVTDSSHPIEREKYRQLVVNYQKKLKLNSFDKMKDVQNVVRFSQAVLDWEQSTLPFNLDQSLKIWTTISDYTNYISGLLTDVDLLVDRHGKTHRIIRYVHAIHLSIPEELFSPIGNYIENHLNTKRIEFQLFPISEPTAIFPERGLWFFLRKGKINDIFQILSGYYARYGILNKTKVFYNLSENLRFKMAQGINTKHQFGKFSSYAYGIKNLVYNCSLNSQVFWIIENSRGNSKEIKILNKAAFSDFVITNRKSLQFDTGVTSQSIVFNFRKMTKIENNRKDYNTMKSKCKVFISYSNDSFEHVSKIKIIVDRLRNEKFEVYFYEDEPLGIDMVNFMRNLKTCDIALIIGTPQYQKRAYEIDSSGVSFEDRIIADIFMSEDRDKIVPIAFGEFKDSFPVPFNTLKGMSIMELNNDRLDQLVVELLTIYNKHKTT